MVVLDAEYLKKSPRPWRNVIFCIAVLLTAIELVIYAVGVIRDDTLRYDRMIGANSFRNQIIADYGLHPRDLIGAPPSYRRIITDLNTSATCGSSYSQYFLENRSFVSRQRFDSHKKACADQWKLIDSALKAEPPKPHGFINLVSHMFLHGGLLHLFLNLMALGAYGGALIWRMTATRILGFFLVCGLGGGAVFALTELAGNHLGLLGERDASLVGASGAIFGIFGSDLRYRYRRYRRAKPKYRSALTKAKLNEFVSSIICLNLVLIAAESYIAGAAHLGGFFIGFLIAPLFWKRPQPRQP